MARTFNRAPVQFNTPSSSDIKNYYFNHFNWKGVNKDKNFLAVDQETFADADNVYVNEEGVLRSRPSIKKINNIGGLSAIKSLRVFNNIIVVFVETDEFTGLKFYDNEEHHLADLSLSTIDVKLHLVNNRIFVFAKDAFYYYDIVNNVIGDAKDFIYIPNTTFDSAGAKTDVEDENILTTQEKYTYLYTNGIGVSSEIYGKDVVAELDGKTYNILFDVHTPDVLMDSLFEVGDLELIVSNKETFLLFDRTNRTFSYSATGLTFMNTFTLNESHGEILGSPKFSQDGFYVIVATVKSLYIISVESDMSTGELRYPIFTNVALNVRNFSWVSPWVQYVAFDFFTYDNFVYSYSWNEGPHNTGLTTDVCLCENGVVISKPVFNPQVNVGMEEDPIEDDPTTWNYSNFILDIVYNPAYVGNKFTGAISIACGRWENDEDILDFFCYTLELKTFHPWHESIRKHDINNLKLLDVKMFLNSIGILICYEEYGVTYYGYSTFDYGFNFTEDVCTYSADVVIKDGKISDDGSRLLLSIGIIYVSSGERKPLLFGESKPLRSTGNHFYINDKKLYTTKAVTALELHRYVQGDVNLLMPSYISTLSSEFIAVDNTVYITEYREDKNGHYLWYIPERNKHVFNKKITNLVPISTTEVGIFFENEIWFMSKVEAGYTVTKSKLQVGVKDGGDIITSFDGSVIMFCSDRGFVGLTYQDFVASTDQIVSFLSDPIYNDIDLFVDQPVKLFKHGHWIILYRVDAKNGYVFDIRNNSWWPVSYHKFVDDIVVIDNNVRLLSNGSLHKLDKSHEKYYDYDGTKKDIMWFITSQKLHLSATNYYKHIVNITLSTVLDTDDDVTFDLDIVNYRKDKDLHNPTTLSYKVDSVRTFVQRLNYFKVNEFQYTLKTDSENTKLAPLSLSDITVKYKLTGQVR